MTEKRVHFCNIHSVMSTLFCGSVPTKRILKQKIKAYSQQSILFNDSFWISLKNQYFSYFSGFTLVIKIAHSTCLDTLELITYADLFPRRYVFGNKSAIFPFLGRSRVWMYILRQFVSMIWFVIESQELSFHAFLFDTIILVRIPEQTHFRWQNQND